jgi:hypothetical protein
MLTIFQSRCELNVTIKYIVYIYRNLQILNMNHFNVQFFSEKCYKAANCHESLMSMPKAYLVFV